MKKQVNVRLNDENTEFYEVYFKKAGIAAVYIMEAIPSIFRKTLQELSSIFLDGELKLIVDAFKGFRLTPQMAGRHIIIQCADKIDIDKLDEKWGVDRQVFLGKLEPLPIFSKCILEIWAHGFWEGKEKKMEDWIKPLQGG